jgi:hypothetical protein
MHGHMSRCTVTCHDARSSDCQIHSMLPYTLVSPILFVRSSVCCEYLKVNFHSDVINIQIPDVFGTFRSIYAMTPHTYTHTCIKVNCFATGKHIKSSVFFWSRLSLKPQDRQCLYNVFTMSVQHRMYIEVRSRNHCLPSKSSKY